MPRLIIEKISVISLGEPPGHLYSLVPSKDSFVAKVLPLTESSINEGSVMSHQSQAFWENNLQNFM